MVKKWLSWRCSNRRERGSGLEEAVVELLPELGKGEVDVVEVVGVRGRERVRVREGGKHEEMCLAMDLV